MTPEMERIGKILLDAEGIVLYTFHGERQIPDFSKWTNFGRLLKIKDSLYERMEEVAWLMLHRDISDIIDKTKTDDIDQIPTLVATELAKVLEEK